MNVLYVEDEPNDAQLVDLYIRTTPHRLTIAKNGAEARAAFAHQPDLILIDVWLGSARDGYTLIREFHAHGYTGPVIAVTALTTPKDIDDCQKAGFDDILHKPFLIEQLAAVIDKYAVSH